MKFLKTIFSRKYSKIYHLNSQQLSELQKGLSQGVLSVEEDVDTEPRYSVIDITKLKTRIDILENEINEIKSWLEFNRF